jgi:hypothetical protein
MEISRDSTKLMTDDLNAVAQAEQQLAAAHLQLDLETIEYLLHPDYVIIQPGGKVEYKRQPGLWF